MNRRTFLRFGAGGIAAAMLPLSTGCSTTSLPSVELTGGPLAIGADGTRFEADPDGHAIVIARDGREQRIGGLGREAGKLNYPVAIAMVGEIAHVVDHGNHRVQLFDASGTSVGMLGEGELFHPSGIAVLPETGEVLVADSRNARILGFAADGSVTRVLGEGALSAPRGLALRGGHIVVADPGQRQVIELDAAGGVVHRHTGWVLPYDVATDGTNLYVADVSARRITVVDRRGTHIDTLDLDVAPRTVMFAADGLLYVS